MAGKALMVWSGLDEYRKELAALPKDCTGEAAHEIEAAANSVTVEIKTDYPWGPTGNLRNGVSVSRVYVKNDTVAGAVVRSGAPHAIIYERGTDPRWYFTHNGVIHRTGVMPAIPTFVPRIVRARRNLTQRLKDMVKRHGATSVTGD